jgi:lipopolysaccharide transport system ATP-binding protein
MEILKFAVHSANNSVVGQCESGEVIKITLEIQSHESGLVPNVGFQLRDRFGNLVVGTNTRMLGFSIPAQERNVTFRITFDIKLMIGSGEYTLTCAVASDDAKPERIYDWVDQLASFVVVASDTYHVVGLAYCPVVVSGLSTLTEKDSGESHDFLPENGPLT